MLSLFIGIALFFTSTRLSPNTHFQTLIVWNVGQGQWLTYKDLHGDCYHFDCGGEKAPWTALHAVCPRRNFLYITHEDRDHVGFRSHGKNKLRWITPPKPSWLLHWSPTSKPGIGDKTAAMPSQRNHSTIYSLHQDVLITGDNPQKLERLFVTNKDFTLRHTRLLVLGHHGSKTSTSRELLAALPNLKMAVASARLAKYGHPHPEVLAKLQKRKTPVLRTEHWGHIWFKL